MTNVMPFYRFVCQGCGVDVERFPGAHTRAWPPGPYCVECAFWRAVEASKQAGEPLDIFMRPING